MLREPEEGQFVLEEGAENLALTPAAVLFPIVLRDGGHTVLLTQRTAHLRDHAGQISFPGGRVEPEDASPVHTALRETEEEIGLAREHIEVLGFLPEYRTGTGFQVTPVVAFSSAVTLVRPTMPCLAATYADFSAEPTRPWTEATLMMRPQLAACMAGKASRVV